MMSLNLILLVPASVGSTCLWPGVDTILHLGVLSFWKTTQIYSRLLSSSFQGN